MRRKMALWFDLDFIQDIVRICIEHLLQHEVDCEVERNTDRDDQRQHESGPTGDLHDLLLRMPLARRGVQDVDLLFLARASGGASVHALLSLSRAAHDNSTIRSQSCGKVMPTAAAALGSKLVAVMPGMVLISRQ